MEKGRGGRERERKAYLFGASFRGWENARRKKEKRERKKSKCKNSGRRTISSLVLVTLPLSQSGKNSF